MAQVSFTSFYYGPTAVYTSPTGLTDSTTGAPQKGGNFNLGDYADLTESEAQQWNVHYGTTLHQGRYRIVKLANNAVAANTGLGKPLGWGVGTTVEQVTFAPGTGYTPGNYDLVSTGGGTPATQAAAHVVVGPTGAIISAKLSRGGSGFSTVPTFALTALGAGTGGTVIAQMSESANTVTTYDASAISPLGLVRAINLSPVTAAQITAGAFIIVQELGIAPVLVNLGALPAGAALTAVGSTGTPVVTATTPVAATSPTVGTFAYSLDATAVNGLVRGVLNLPVLQG
jgi:hypothetical protein